MEIVFPDSPAGTHARWWVEHTSSRGEKLTEAEVAEHVALPPPWTPAQGVAHFRERGDEREFTIASAVSKVADEVEVIFDYGDDKPWKLTLTCDPAPPHRVVRTWWARAIADDIVIRPAGAGDAAALNDLEVRAPMTLGDRTTVVYDRGQDFLAFSRLMEENICFVAERGGDLLGIACGAAHTVRIGGGHHRVMLLHHLRVPVEHRKGGVFSTINGHVFGAYEGRTDAAYGYTALDNAEAMRIGGPGTWSTGVYRVVLDCELLAGPPVGRTATPDDAARIVEILNACHQREEVYLPYTVESFTTRLERAPDLYTWSDVLVADGAVLGVWPTGTHVTVDEGGSGRETVRAVALDYGFVGDGGPDEFEALLRSSCARLGDQGHTELTFVASEASPNYALLDRLATRVDAFAFRMGVPEPPGTPERGVYVDAIYF